MKTEKEIHEMEETVAKKDKQIRRLYILLSLSFFVLLVLFIILWTKMITMNNLYVKTHPDTVPAVSTSASANDSNAEAVTDVDAKYSLLSPEEIMENAREVTPSLAYTCPYEDSKCVETMIISDDIKHLTSWDIYIFNLDNVIGTWIVNEAGNNICFYGDAFLYLTDNRAIHMGRCVTDAENIFYEGHLCIRPNLSDIDGFVVSTYPWNITSPITP